MLNTNQLAWDKMNGLIPAIVQDAFDGRLLMQAYMNREALEHSLDSGRVTFLGNRLFRAGIHLPANVPTGTYQVKVFLLQDGRVVSAQTTPLQVSKVGAEAAVYDFAYRNSALYGLIAILVALMAGWAAHLVFRKA